MSETTYTADDAGCYVNSAQGIYATDAIVEFARAHGATIVRDCDCDHEPRLVKSEFASCEWAGDYEDLANDYMHEHYPVPGHYWGRNECGDWGLWRDEDNA